MHWSYVFLTLNHRNTLSIIICLVSLGVIAKKRKSTTRSLDIMNQVDLEHQAAQNIIVTSPGAGNQIISIDQNGQVLGNQVGRALGIDPVLMFLFIGNFEVHPRDAGS